MKRVTPFPDLALASEEAALWVARQDRGLSVDEQGELRRWCANPANARALRQLGGLWAEMDGMRSLTDLLHRDAAPADTDAIAADEAPEMPAAAPAASAPRHRRGMLAASLLLAAVAAGWLGHGHYMQRPDVPQLASLPILHATAVGEQRELQLADGSTLAVNTDSAVEVVAFDASVRQLRLQRGEALFTVAHDPQRPFRVQVGGRVVEAVGTAFDIRAHEDGRFDVIVTEGRVRILQGDSTLGFADSGHAVRVAGDGVHITAMDDEDIAARLAWREGEVVLDGETLAAALDEFSRYTTDRFVIVDPWLRDLRIGGYFPVRDVDALLSALRAGFDLQVTRAADGSILIGSPVR